MIYVEGPVSPEDVIRRERQLKGWTHAKKLALILDDKDE